MISALTRRPSRISGSDIRDSPHVVRAAPTLNASGWWSQLIGHVDPDAPSVDRQRKSYAGLVWRFTQIRADFASRAMIEAVVERKTAQGEAEAVGMAHPWARLLTRPHPTIPPLLFWKWVQLAKDFGTGAALVVERDAAGLPLYLHPVYPDFGTMRPVGAPDGTIEKFVYMPTGAAGPVDYPRENVIWIHHAHPVTPYESASMIEVAASAIDARRYAELYQATQAKSGGYPAAYASGDFGSQDKADEFGTRFVSRYLPDPDTGRVVRRIPVLPTDVTIHPLSIAPADMRAIETMDATTDDLKLMFLGTAAMGSADATYSNSTQATRDFIQFVGQPEADANAAMLSAGLDTIYSTPMPRRGEVVVTVPDLMPLDPEERRKDLQLDLANGLSTIDEIREERGQKTWGGDAARPHVSGLLMPLRIDDDPEPQAPAGGPSAPREPASSATDDDEADDEPSRSVTVDPGRLRLTPNRADGGEDPMAAQWRMIDARKTRAERPLLSVSRTYIQSVAEETARAIRDADTSRAAPKDAGALLSLVFNVRDWLDRLASDLGPAVLSVLREGFATGALSLPVDLSADLTFDAGRASVRRALARSLEKASSVPETLRGEVARSIAAGIEAGETYQQIADRVQAQVEGLADWQARRIARTTGTQAFEAGQQQAWTEAGITKNRWLTERDDKVRPEHAALDGEEAVIGQAFSNGSTQPEDINCRCTLLPVVDDEPRSVTERDRYIIETYARRVDEVGRGVALAEIRDHILDRVESDGWRPIGERQILRIAKGHES